MAVTESFQYDGTFSDNILVVGQTGCGKTSFIQSLGKNKIFGDGLKSVDWISKICLSRNREDEIRACFNYTTIQFHYPDDWSISLGLLTLFKMIHLRRQRRPAKKTIVTFLVKKIFLIDLLLWTDGLVSATFLAALLLFFFTEI